MRLRIPMMRPSSGTLMRIDGSTCSATLSASARISNWRLTALTCKSLDAYSSKERFAVNLMILSVASRASRSRCSRSRCIDGLPGRLDLLEHRRIALCPDGYHIDLTVDETTKCLDEVEVPCRDRRLVLAQINQEVEVTGRGVECSFGSRSSTVQDHRFERHASNRPLPALRCPSTGLRRRPSLCPAGGRR